LLWIGGHQHDELRVARAAAGRMAEVHDAATIDEALDSPAALFNDRCPAVILLASTTPVSWCMSHCVALSRRWPLAPLVSVATTLVEGRRRSGPPLAGIEEVAWNELSGRLAWWLHDRRRGVPGSLGQPATARREERLLEVALRVAEHAALGGTSVDAVSVAASRGGDLDGVADVLAAVGRPIRTRTRGRPPLDDPADVIVWDAASITAADLTWVALLAAHRPSRAVILLDSFPRADTARAAIDAGAAAVLGRPVSLESLSGALLGIAARVCG
jgi:hypothetical protein